MQLPLGYPAVIALCIIFAAFEAEAGFTAQCFTAKFSRGISGAVPVAELWQVTVADCLNYCIFKSAKAGDGCASVVFHKEFSTCQLYGHDGTYNGGEIVEAKNHDYYNRTSYVGACQDRAVPARGYQKRPRQYSITTHTMAPAAPVFKEMPSLPELEKREQLTEPKNSVESQRIGKLEEFYDEEPEIEEDGAVTFYNPTKTNVCSKREKISYFVLFGYALSASTKPAKLRGVDQSSCIMYCSQNINATGAASACFAANYDPIKEECRLYGKSAKNHRHSANLVPNPNIIFADKFCMQTKKDCSAESPYIVYLEKQMTKQIVAHYPDVHSLVACIALCIDNIECRAVTFKKGGLCILHGASPATDSSLLVPGTPQTMVIENGCQLIASAVPSLLSGSLDSMTAPQVEDASPWSEWSGCQFGKAGQRMRARSRDCFTDPCEDVQFQTCDQ